MSKTIEEIKQDLRKRKDIDKYIDVDKFAESRKRFKDKMQGREQKFKLGISR